MIEKQLCQFDHAAEMPALIDSALATLIWKSLEDLRVDSMHIDLGKTIAPFHQ